MTPQQLDHVTEIAAEFHARWARNAKRFHTIGAAVPFQTMPQGYRDCLVETIRELIVAGVIVPNWFQ